MPTSYGPFSKLGSSNVSKNLSPNENAPFVQLSTSSSVMGALPYTMRIKTQAYHHTVSLSLSLFGHLTSSTICAYNKFLNPLPKIDTLTPEAVENQYEDPTMPVILATTTKFPSSPQSGARNKKSLQRIKPHQTEQPARWLASSVASRSQQ